MKVLIKPIGSYSNSIFNSRICKTTSLNNGTMCKWNGLQKNYLNILSMKILNQNLKNQPNLNHLKKYKSKNSSYCPETGWYCQISIYFNARNLIVWSFSTCFIWRGFYGKTRKAPINYRVREASIINGV